MKENNARGSFEQLFSGLLPSCKCAMTYNVLRLHVYCRLTGQRVPRVCRSANIRYLPNNQLPHSNLPPMTHLRLPNSRKHGSHRHNASHSPRISLTAPMAQTYRHLRRSFRRRVLRCVSAYSVCVWFARFSHIACWLT